MGFIMRVIDGINFEFFVEKIVVSVMSVFNLRRVIVVGLVVF